MVQTLVSLILIIACCFSAHYALTPDINIQTQTSKHQSSKNNEDAEQHLTQLEVLEGLCAELTTTIQQARSASPTLLQQSNTTLEQAVKYLDKDVKMLRTGTMFLTSDVNELKKMVFSLINYTRSMLRSTSQLVTKQFFNQSILNLQHQRLPSESSTRLPKDCTEVKQNGKTLTGIYSIQPEHSSKPVLVVCDLQTRGGGWTVIHNRFNGTQDFHQKWKEYKHGFGNLAGEFWLGLDTIHQLTGYQVNELLIELEDFDKQSKTASYAAFSVGPEVEGFPLEILGGYSGDAGDSLMYHAASKFTTKDVDQDAWSNGNCADLHAGAWWYRECDLSNLNGKYLNGQVSVESTYKGMYWNTFRGGSYSLLKAKMLIRPLAEVFNGV